MRCRRGSQLALLLLLSAAVSLEALDFNVIPVIVRENMSWTEGRHMCKTMFIDMVPAQIGLESMQKTLFYSDVNSSVWVGLHRDPEVDKEWKWIDMWTGEGLTGNDFSQDSNWSPGEQDAHCALLRDGTWHSQLCSAPHHFYCSSGGNIIIVESNATWEEAKSHCENTSSTLATVSSDNSAAFTNEGWIGLQKEGGDTWKWVDGSIATSTNWAAGEPRTRDCASLNGQSKLLHSSECSEKLEPLCFYDNLLVVKENKTWEEAVAHCRELERNCTNCRYRHDLLTVGSEHSTSYITRKLSLDNSTTDELWIGLRYMAGEWWGLRGRAIRNSQTLPDCPSQERCGAVSRHSSGWQLRECTERRNFICGFRRYHSKS